MKQLDQTETLELIERSRQGDRSAQDALMQAIQKKVYYHCKKMLKSEDDALDATQDVLIIVFTSLDKLKEPAAFWGWVNGVTATRCKHLLSEPHKEWQIPEDEEGNSMLDNIEDLDQQSVPEQALDDKETRSMILGLVDDLPPEQRMSVLYYYYDEMSVKEIAEAMEVSEGTVKSRLNYARKAIKRGAEDYERRGVKLYSVSPLLLLVYFLRMDAEAAGISAASAAAMADAVGAAVSAASASAAGGAAGSGSAAAAAAKGAGAAAKAGSALSTKLVAGVLAGAVALGGAGVGIVSHLGSDRQTECASLSAGYGATGLVDTDGSLWVWGVNPSDGRMENFVTTPQEVMDDVTASDCVGATRAALRSDGSLWMWGGNQYGQLGTGDRENVFSPTRVLDGAAAVDCDFGTTLAVKTDGTLWRWGGGDTPLPGSGQATVPAPPIQILEDVAYACSGPICSAAIRTDGSLWMWGGNPSGELGIGTSGEGVSEPVHVMDDVAKVICDCNSTAALKTDGSLWMWGDLVTRLDLEGEIDHRVPNRIADGIVDISFTGWTLAAIKADGSLWMLGRNDFGQLGIGTTESQDAPNTPYALVHVMDDVVDVACGLNHTVAIRSDGSVWAWGKNEYGELGDGTQTPSAVPVQVQFNVENNGAPDWPVDPAVAAANSRPSEPEPEPEPEPEDHSEAYAAYQSALAERKDLLAAYAGWYEATPAVAFADVMGDSTPEVIFVEAAGADSSDSYLTVLTWQDGEVKTALRHSWDFFAGGGLGYVLYQTEGSRELYAVTEHGDEYAMLERTVFRDGGGELSPETLGVRTDYMEDLRTTYFWRGAEVDEAEYNAHAGEYPAKAAHVVLLDPFRIAVGKVDAEGADLLAMSYDRAMKFLAGNAQTP